MNWTAQHEIVVVTVVLSVVAIVFLLQQRRTPQSAAAWLLFFMLVPYLAIPLFLMLGFRKQGSRFAPIAYTKRAGSDAPSDEAARMFEALGAAPAWSGNSFALDRSAEEAERSLEETIRGARGTVEVVLYLLGDDAAGRRFVGLLTEKAREGVDVRIVLDRLGTLARPRRELRAFERAGGRLRFCSPFLHRPDKGHLNLRNHRKLVVADRRVVWAGGRNVGDDYLGGAPGSWEDLSFVASGPVARSFADVFASDWGEGDPTPGRDAAELAEPAGSAVLQLVSSGPDDPSDTLHNGLVNLLHRARRRIWIATPYFVPTEPLQLALATAARRGVEVRIVVPDASNKRTTDLARGAYLRELEHAEAKVQRFMGGMLHAKCGIADDVAWVGSANFDVRSLLLNFELALFGYDAATVAALEEWFETLADRLETGIGPASLPRRVLEGLFRLGAPVL